MANKLTDFDEEIKERPTFLKTLCILTFIYSSFTIVTNIINVINPDRVYKMISSKKKAIGDSATFKAGPRDADTKLSKRIELTLSDFSPEKIKQSAIGSIIVSLLCLAGALLMWRLKRYGYYIYIVGTIAGVALPYYLFGNNFIGVFSTASAGFFGLLFIIFYGMNLKSMR